MPYIITTTVPANRYNADGLAEANVRHETDRRAVATLDEARDAATAAIVDGPNRYGVDKYILETYILPESGGTVGPLPDGTVIEVQQVAWMVIAAMVDTWPPRFAQQERQIIDAYNDAA